MPILKDALREPGQERLSTDECGPQPKEKRQDALPLFFTLTADPDLIRVPGAIFPSSGSEHDRVCGSPFFPSSFSRRRGVPGPQSPPIGGRRCFGPSVAIVLPLTSGWRTHRECRDRRIEKAVQRLGAPRQVWAGVRTACHTHETRQQLAHLVLPPQAQRLAVSGQPPGIIEGGFPPATLLRSSSLSLEAP
jgi:hypothetical protein